MTRMNTDGKNADDKGMKILQKQTKQLTKKDPI